MNWRCNLHWSAGLRRCSLFQQTFTITYQPSSTYQPRTRPYVIYLGGIRYVEADELYTTLGAIAKAFWPLLCHSSKVKMHVYNRGILQQSCARVTHTSFSLNEPCFLFKEPHSALWLFQIQYSALTTLGNHGRFSASDVCM